MRVKVLCRIPGECVVVAVIRDREFVVPCGSTGVEMGDNVVYVGPASAIKEARKRF